MQELNCILPDLHAMPYIRTQPFPQHCSAFTHCKPRGDVLIACSCCST